MRAKTPIDPPMSPTDRTLPRDQRVMSPVRHKRPAAGGRRATQPALQPELIATGLTTGPATESAQLRSTAPQEPVIDYEYKHHVIRIESQRMGWKAAIYPKGSPFAWAGGFYTPEASGRDALIAQAKAAIDKALGLEPGIQADETTTAVPRNSEVSQRFALLARAQQLLKRGWTWVKNIYFSVDRSQRHH
jgi:hypothetical protein